jgi:hypothetical protein
VIVALAPSVCARLSMIPIAGRISTPTGISAGAVLTRVTVMVMTWWTRRRLGTARKNVDADSSDDSYDGNSD